MGAVSEATVRGYGVMLLMKLRESSVKSSTNCWMSLVAL